MNLQEHAKFELELQGMFNEDSEYNGEIGVAVMELIDVFFKQGHSGMSASIVRKLFNDLAAFQQLGPLTGKDEEWFHLGYDGLEYQNKRNSAVFKDKNGVVTYNNSIIKRCENGTCWTGTLYLTREDAINDTNRIKAVSKGFPFVPKTFYIDVIEEEIEKDNWIMWVKDPKQLDEVWEHYDKKIY